MDKIKKMIKEELKEFEKIGSISRSDLDTINKLVVTLEKIDRIEEIEGEEHEEDSLAGEELETIKKAMDILRIQR